MESTQIKIRFNSNFPHSSGYKWRVIEIKNDDWKEHLTNQVIIGAISETTSDLMKNGEIKHHLTVTAYEVFFEGEDSDGFEKVIIH